MPSILDREKQNKPERIPVDGMRDIMTVDGKDPDFEYRWVVDEDERGSRIMRFIRGGWNFARNDSKDGKGDVVVGQEFVYTTKQDGSIIRHNSGNGLFSYLMCIRKEWYDEDQMAKHNNIKETEQSILGTGNSEGKEFGQYGDISIDFTDR